MRRREYGLCLSMVAICFPKMTILMLVWCRAYGCQSVSVGLIFPLFLSVVWICRLELATHHGASCVSILPLWPWGYYKLWRSEWLRDIREDTVLQMQHVLDRVERAELGACVQVRGGNGMFYLGLTCELSWFVVTNPHFGGWGDRQQRTEEVWQYCGRGQGCARQGRGWRRVNACQCRVGWEGMKCPGLFMWCTCCGEGIGLVIWGAGVWEGNV